MKEKIASVIMDELDKEQKVMLYGKGDVGTAIYYFLPDVKIIAWVVTKKDGAEQSFLNVPVIQISDVTNKNCPLIIASREHSEVMIETAQKYGFKKIKRIEGFRL